ncbi:MAG: glycosyltransferase family 39 protein, partial [Verrucomicrobiota bacterium]
MNESTEITIVGGGVTGRRWWEMGLWIVLAFAVGFFWQKMEGADRSEFGGHPDEAAHYVTGLFVHDAVVEGWKYVGGGMKGSPVAVGKEFANDYYAHYPKIGLGVWPPFFYVVQTAWTLPFSVSRTSMLLLLCGLAAVVAGQLFSVLRREFGFWAGIFGGVMWLSLPLVRAGYGMVMAETLCTILIFGAMMAWGDFLDSGKRGDAVRFGIFAGLAIMTKGTGMALALAAPLALVGSRRWGLFLRFELWLGVILVAILAGPWTWATCHLGRGG